MSDEKQKWTSPHGHAIASHETDKQVTKTPENVTCENLTNAALLAEAVGIITDLKRLHEFGMDMPVGFYRRSIDFLAKIER